MAVPHYNYYPPAGTVFDANDRRVSWDGRRWMRGGKSHKIPSSHHLMGSPNGPLAGWTYDWKLRAWMEPSKPTPRPPTPGPSPRPVVPTAVAKPTPTIATEIVHLDKKSPLESLVHHPVAPLVGGFLIAASYLTDEPAPPAIPAGLDTATAAEWQMTYTRNQQRFSRRMEMIQDLGKVLLGYASVQTVLDAVPRVVAANDNHRPALMARAM